VFTNCSNLFTLQVILQQKQDALHNSLSVYGSNDVSSDGATLRVAKVECVSPTEHLTKRHKIS